jgi:hypothetical protein
VWRILFPVLYTILSSLLIYSYPLTHPQVANGTIASTAVGTVLRRPATSRGVSDRGGRRVTSASSRVSHREGRSRTRPKTSPPQVRCVTGQSVSLVVSGLSLCLCRSLTHSLVRSSRLMSTRVSASLSLSLSLSLCVCVSPTTYTGGGGGAICIR